MIFQANFSLLLFVVLFFQCSIDNNQNINGTEVPRQPQTISSVEVAKRDCNFSAYSPLTISHFYPNKVIKAVKPKYPTSAISRGVEGWVMVKILVNKAGNVEKTCVLEGNKELRQVAETAALQWKFKPNFGFDDVRVNKKKSNKTTYVQAILPFHFILKDTDDKDIGITVRPQP